MPLQRWPATASPSLPSWRTLRRCGGAQQRNWPSMPHRCCHASATLVQHGLENFSANAFKLQPANSQPAGAVATKSAGTLNPKQHLLMSLLLLQVIAEGGPDAEAEAPYIWVAQDLLATRAAGAAERRQRAMLAVAPPAAATGMPSAQEAGAIAARAVKQVRSCTDSHPEV